MKPLHVLCLMLILSTVAGYPNLSWERNGPKGGEYRAKGKAIEEADEQVTEEEVDDEDKEEASDGEEEKDDYEEFDDEDEVELLERSEGEEDVEQGDEEEDYEEFDDEDKVELLERSEEDEDVEEEDYEEFDEDEVERSDEVGNVEEDDEEEDYEELYDEDEVEGTKIGDRKLEKITFGGEGTEPGKFRGNYGVAVSADSEVFVADYLNKRVQVFSMNGTYLRLFPTVLPGENRLMYPCSIGQEPGYLWIVVRRDVYSRGVGHVVQYSKNGQPMKKFDVHFISDSSSPVITIDARHDKVIVGEGDTIMMFHPNGSFCRRFKLPKTPGTWVEIRGAATDREGNILLTDYAGVKVYSHSGVKILEIGIRFPLGVCVDSLGRIIVANRDDNRVDMFTRRGEFIRTIGADIEEPWAIAMGPGGLLVVTSKLSNTVTIFPRHMLSF
ncbi:PREDICTED: E3 ubiquitin-protein ligase TRIM71-like [Branchiostoma belcheri]|uniref:E3 ubiquitin-protein ligase TRIM71-like n=1 Tax=Branchiostoma belcheri TaxID=7741 RepID=A0A6P4ZTQ6_BRABE|nr:PREDICTED: E3 ubiquitin-protein ligase TRIM71-like [Branchiostoma belcheri]